ncbi:hypothetical protein GYH30_000423 [Glycine max]|uniref:Uncharacterized protein n=2 Tax=Glycine subgen. Soja TaxID=1462606 RepID=K7K1P6_SOYBN|nr:hypothetical protein JHK86_000385 [Glycine max]KAH1161536.1 hypothetical protein GYH30_000423 [Glycine max]RZC28397.1 hypothetical protein D0Y65_000400 [Glycine soja]
MYVLNLMHDLQSVAIRFIKRQSNRVTHSLTRISRFYASYHLFDFAPTCIKCLIFNEMIDVMC